MYVNNTTTTTPAAHMMSSAWVRFYKMVGFTADADRGEFARQVVCPLPEWLPPDEERRRRNF